MSEYQPAKKCGVPGCFNPIKGKLPMCRSCVCLTPRDLTEDLRWWAREAERWLSESAYHQRLMHNPSRHDTFADQRAALDELATARHLEALAGYELSLAGAIRYVEKTRIIHRSEKSGLVAPGAYRIRIREFAKGQAWA